MIEAMSKPRKPRKKEDPPKEAAKPPFNPLPIIQDDQDAIDREMEELFDEDRVTHRHGSTEPERD